ncbi:hypothetical protein F443_03808 [Phytophthora nicotianae P1569]|uniref:HAT C-terminal dimerisation domain-containing protein n=1 Tax=Phytophthora nicotianae P1569 TaxID=1317065 RepID=V9FP03_PHYNI|nr:hypothetical protein F443_03808 [Phytophthora nicotianae P1569]
MMFKDLCDMGAVCNACNTFVSQSRKAGYTNLQAHLVRNHPGYDTVVRSCIKEKRIVSMDMFIDRHAHTTYQWMKLVVHKNFTLADVDDPTIRDAVRFDSISSKTLKARMIAAVKLAELDMCAELKGEKYVLVFDGVAATRLRRNPVPQRQSSKKAQRTGKASQPKTKPNVGRQKRTRTNSQSESEDNLSEPPAKRKRTPSEVKAAIIKRAKTREEHKSAFVDLAWIPATSVQAERLFSLVKCTLGYLRKRMSVETLESILYLRMNWDLVTNEIVSKSIKTAREEDLEDEEECDSNFLTRDAAEGVLRSGAADLVGFVRLFLSNPDLVERFQNDWPLNDLVPHEHYWDAHMGDVGYNMYNPYIKQQESS